MGKVICPRHGGAPGPLACVHVSDAIWRGERIRTHEIELDLDLGDVGTLTGYVCELCREAHDTDSLALVCAKCLDGS